MTKKRVGIIGCGAVVDFFYARYLPLIDNITVFGVCDRNRENARRVSQRFNCSVLDADDLAAEADCIIIATPPSSHEALALRALDLECDVFVEKPFTTSLVAAQGLVRFAKEKNRCIHVGQFRRFFPSVQLMRQIIQLGSLGRVVALDLIEGGRFRWSAQTDYFVSDRYGGVLYDTGAHTLDMGLFATGLDQGEDQRVEIENLSRDKTEPAHEFDSRFKITSTHGTVSCRLKLSRFSALANRVRVSCERGWVECGLWPAATVRLGSGTQSVVIRQKDDTLSDGECFRRQLQALFDGDAAPIIRGELFLNQMQLLETLIKHE